MSNCKFSVTVSLAQGAEESMEQMLHGDGFPLSPPFDKIDQEAKKNKGDFYSWNTTSCDYCFESKEDAERFMKNIRRKFKDKIEVKFQEDQERGHMKSFKSLPDGLQERISELTPKTINGKKVGIHLIDSGVLLLPEKEEHSELFRLTYANIRCKVRGKVISQPLILRSAPKMVERVLKKTKKTSFEQAKAAGWQNSDIFYDSIINSIFKQDVCEEKYNNKSCPEIGFATTHVKIVIADYFGEQFIGWFFYNENLDEPMNYTSYSS